MEQLKQGFSDHSDQSEDVLRMLKIYFQKNEIFFSHIFFFDFETNYYQSNFFFNK